MRKPDISMPDDAEGQRLNLSSVMKLTDMSKLSLGRLKLVQSTSVQMNILNLAKIGVMPVVARRNGPTCVRPKEHFVLVKPLRPRGRTSGGGVKKCMTYCIDKGQWEP